MIIQGSPEILRGPRGLNGFGDFGAPEDAVKALFLTITGREADPAGLKYFTDRFGTTIEPGEATIFQNMAQAEIQARNAFLAQQSAAAQATALAEIEAKQNQGKTYFSNAIIKAEDMNTVYHEDGSYTQYYKDGIYTTYYKDGSYETFGLPRATGLEDIVIGEPAVSTTPKGGCPPGYAWDGTTCRPTGLKPIPTFTRGEFEGDAFVLPGINYTRLLAVAVAAAFFIGG